jgi:hypothetical protein
MQHLLARSWTPKAQQRPNLLLWMTSCRIRFCGLNTFSRLRDTKSLTMLFIKISKVLFYWRRMEEANSSHQSEILLCNRQNWKSWGVSWILSHGRDGSRFLHKASTGCFVSKVLQLDLLLDLNEDDVLRYMTRWEWSSLQIKAIPQECVELHYAQNKEGKKRCDWCVVKKLCLL